MNSEKAADLGIFILCCLVLLLYNILYFTPWFQNLKIKWHRRRYVNMWSIGVESRAIWFGSMIADPKEGITTAQTIRNMVMGVSVLAAGITLLAGQLLVLITDSARLEQVAKYSTKDPISGSAALMPPEAKLGIALGILFVSLLSMTQCVRLCIHLTYIIRAAPAAPRRFRKFTKIGLAMNRRASLSFSIGLRFLYAFFPLFLYILGPLALLISTIVEVVALFLMDLTPEDVCYQEDDVAETEAELEDEIAEKRYSKTATSANEQNRERNGHSDGGELRHRTVQESREESKVQVAILND